jgi:hypothetical protein
VSARYGYDLHRTARLQALLNMAMPDGFVVGWFQKRHFAFWRPVTAIREGDIDGNPKTEPDPSWLSLRPTPALPDYPSTHSLLGGAAAEILRGFTGTSRFPFCMVSDDLRTVRDSGAGTHLLETGVKVGRKVGKFALQHSLVPLSWHDRRGPRRQAG